MYYYMYYLKYAQSVGVHFYIHDNKLYNAVQQMHKVSFLFRHKANTEIIGLRTMRLIWRILLVNRAPSHMILRRRSSIRDLVGLGR